jgi:phospholipid/cholesterol/gamma-HCH transport system substrate-binding protein
MSERISPAIRRALAGGLLAAAALVVLLLGTGASGGGGGTYLVRAIFDSASFVVPGEDVKVAGVKVGAIQALDVTPDNKAAIVLRIDDPAFQDFKRDAHCTIRLQSLIGEKFVACEPTQPKGANTAPAPSLRKITRGPGKGQYLLPVANTSSPVDIDLLNTVMREPQRQRFAIIINELGVGLAGNGQELNAVIRRADPALYQLDRVLAILAAQNRTLARLAVESDAALAPVAQQSQSISDFIDKAGATAAASAARGDAIEQSFSKLPTFLQQLDPTVKRLGEFAAAGTPVMRDLRAAAPSVNTLFEQLGPFSAAALPTFRTLGNLADTGRQALPAAEPIIRDIHDFAVEAKPFASVLARALTNLQGQRGIEDLLTVILETTGTINGFDSVSHYLRTFLTIPANCIPYAIQQDGQCTATFRDVSSVQPVRASAASQSAAGTTTTVPSAASPPAAPAGTTTDSGSAGGTTAVSGTGAGGGSGSASDASSSSGLLNYLLGGSGQR